MKNFKTYGQFLTEAYSDEERRELADKGFALSDGSFPIKDLKDLKNAIQAYGRAKDQARAAKFIAKRAKALGAEDLIPDTEDFQKSLSEGKLTEAKAIKVTKKIIDDIEDSGNIDIAYRKAIALLKSLSESVAVGSAIHDVSTELPAKTIALILVCFSQNIKKQTIFWFDKILYFFRKGLDS
jgi:hypothetical protein